MNLLSPSVKALNWDGWCLKTRFPTLYFLFALLKAQLVSLSKKKKPKKPSPKPNKKLHKTKQTNNKKVFSEKSCRWEVKTRLAAVERSPQNPAVPVATLQMPPFSSPTVYQTGRSVSKWEEMERGGSFFMHIYSFSFEGCQIWMLNATHICSLKSRKTQHLASHSCQIHACELKEKKIA